MGFPLQVLEWLTYSAILSYGRYCMRFVVISFYQICVVCMFEYHLHSNCRSERPQCVLPEPIPRNYTLSMANSIAKFSKAPDTCTNGTLERWDSSSGKFSSAHSDGFSASHQLHRWSICFLLMSHIGIPRSSISSCECLMTMITWHTLALPLALPAANT